MESVPIKAELRQGIKKTAAKALRKIGKIPGIMYGPDISSTKISIGHKDLMALIRRANYKGLILDVSFEPEGLVNPQKCLIKEIQWDPFMRQPLHIDLYAVSKGHEIEVDIPLSFVNTPVGVTKGGIFEAHLREISVSCLLEDLVSNIEVDVSSLDIGDSLHIKDLNLPKGIKARVPAEEVVAVVNPPPEEGVAEASESETS